MFTQEPWSPGEFKLTTEHPSLRPQSTASLHIQVEASGPTVNLHNHCLGSTRPEAEEPHPSFLQEAPRIQETFKDTYTFQGPPSQKLEAPTFLSPGQIPTLTSRLPTEHILGSTSMSNKHLKFNNVHNQSPDTHPHCPVRKIPLLPHVCLCWKWQLHSPS